MRVAVTGIGLVTPIGAGREAVWEGLLSGRCGIGAVRSFDPSAYASDRGAEIPDFQPSSLAQPAGRRLGRSSQIAVTAAEEAPVFAAVLTWVTRTQSGFLGFIYLFVFSLGMCALLVAIGVSSGTLARLPRAGVWMVRVKRVFGLVMLGVAEYYLVKMGQVLL
jgi:hypothetical protein